MALIAVTVTGGSPGLVSQMTEGLVVPGFLPLEETAAVHRVLKLTLGGLGKLHLRLDTLYFSPVDGLDRGKGGSAVCKVHKAKVAGLFYLVHSSEFVEDRLDELFGGGWSEIFDEGSFDVRHDLLIRLADGICPVGGAGLSLDGEIPVLDLFLRRLGCEVASEVDKGKAPVPSNIVGVVEDNDILHLLEHGPQGREDHIFCHFPRDGPDKEAVGLLLQHHVEFLAWPERVPIEVCHTLFGVFLFHKGDEPIPAVAVGVRLHHQAKFVELPELLKERDKLVLPIVVRDASNKHVGLLGNTSLPVRRRAQILALASRDGHPVYHRGFPLVGL